MPMNGSSMISDMVHRGDQLRSVNSSLSANERVFTCHRLSLGSSLMQLRPVVRRLVVQITIASFNPCIRSASQRTSYTIGLDCIGHCWFLDSNPLPLYKSEKRRE